MDRGKTGNAFTVFDSSDKWPSSCKTDLEHKARQRPDFSPQIYSEELNRSAHASQSNSDTAAKPVWERTYFL